MDNQKDLALWLMAYQQDAFMQDFGYTMPHELCRRKVADMVTRMYKKRASIKDENLEKDLDYIAVLFWSVIQLKGDEEI